MLIPSTDPALYFPQALKWYKEGKIDEIKKYCLKDVEITKNLYDFGRKNGHVLFYSRSAGGRVAIPVAWEKQSVLELNKDAQLKIF